MKGIVDVTFDAYKWESGYRKKWKNATTRFSLGPPLREKQGASCIPICRYLVSGPFVPSFILGCMH